MKSSVVNGKYLGSKIMGDLSVAYSKLPRKVVLGLLIMDPDFAAEKFLTIKRNLAGSLGVLIEERNVEAGAQTADVLQALTELVAKADGVIVQLPLPTQVDIEAVLSAIPASHDVDGIGGGKETMLPPVVGAIAEILAHESQLLFGKKVVIVGKGRLVGEPASRWFKEQGSTVVLLEKGDDVASETIDADVIVLGAGSPGLLTPEMVKDDVVILDAGTSEVAGKLAGDADPALEQKARLFSPVPGGIGPVAVAVIFKNLLQLVQKPRS